jgi:hypothetical protein
MDAETGEPPQAVAPLSAAEAQAASPADADGDVEWEPAEGEAGPSLVPPRAPPPPMRAATSAITAEKTVTAPGWRGAIQRSRSPLELPRELAREYPRLRIIIGFALVVALGAIGPTCYASSVLDKKVQPLLVDLSTAKAHGQLMMGLPGYRSPEQVQAEIDSITSRHATYAFLMWLVVSGALGFLWFRFVRAE